MGNSKELIKRSIGTYYFMKSRYSSLLSRDREDTASEINAIQYRKDANEVNNPPNGMGISGKHSYRSE